MAPEHQDRDVYSVRVMSAVSTTVSSLTGLVADVVRSYFPPGYFRSTRVGTYSRAARLSREPGSGRPRSELPLLAVTPRYEEMSEPIFDPQPQANWASRFALRPLSGNHPAVLLDEEGGRRIYAMQKRLRVSFEVRVLVQQRTAAMDVMQQLSASFEAGGYFFYNGAALSARLPRHLVGVVAASLGLDPSAPEGAEALRAYLRAHSGGSVARKRDPASGLDVYSYDYRVNVLMGMPDRPSAAFNMKEMVEDECEVSLQLTAEAWYPNRFLLEVLADPSRPLPADPGRGPTDLLPSEPELVELNPQRLHVPYARYAPGAAATAKNLVERVAFVTEADAEVDVLPLRGAVPAALLRAAAWSLSRPGSPPVGSWLELVLYRDGEELSSPGDFSVSWPDEALTLASPFSNYPHTLAVYADLEAARALHGQAEAAGFEWPPA